MAGTCWGGGEGWEIGAALRPNLFAASCLKKELSGQAVGMSTPSQRVFLSAAKDLLKKAVLLITSDPSLRSRGHVELGITGYLQLANL